MDVERQTTVIRGGPDTNPMNLTCKPTLGTVPEKGSITGEVISGDDAATKYAVVMNGDKPATAPNSTWNPIFVSTEEYTIASSDGLFHMVIPAGDLAIYSK